MSTACFSRSASGLTLALFAGLAMTACEVDRPKEAYTPTKREVTQGNSELFKDAGPEPTSGSDAMIDDPVIVVENDGGMMVSPDSPVAKAQGFYWLRTDIEFTYSQSAGFQQVRVFNRASHMALTQLVADGQTLKAIERTCHVFYQHKCLSACSSFSTTVAPQAANLYRTQHLPRVYTLTNNNMFTTNTASLTLGWTGPPDPMPASLSDPSVWDASDDATSKGFYVNVKAGGLPQVVDCFYNTVERFTSSYSGELSKTGSLDGINAKLATDGSKADTLDSQGGAACVPSNTAPPAASRSTVRFVRAEGGENFWNCPALADFKAKLADPPGAP